MACIEVFALGGVSKTDDASETGYFAVRAALTRSISQAAEYIAEKGLAEEGAPAIVRLIVQISERFSIQVSEKAAAQAVPVIGAAGGAIINNLFMDHFQNMARGHFIVRRLERKYGKDVVKKMYESF
ncbi:MAG: EcsC family protein [Phycisphaerae bacterium]